MAKKRSKKKMSRKSSTSRRDRDVEKAYAMSQFISKIRRLADALERGKPFSIQVKNERIHVPKGATVNIEHEREGRDEEVEFQLKWRNETPSKEKGR